MFSNKNLPNSLEVFYLVWAFSFPYDYPYLPLPGDSMGTVFIGLWIVWLGLGGLVVIPLGEWMVKKRQ